MDNKELIEKILSHQSRSWLNGDGIYVEEILAKHSTIANDDDAVLDIVVNEYCNRRRKGDKRAGDDLLRRFPTIKDRLKLLFEVADAVEENVETVILNEDFSRQEYPQIKIDGCEILARIGKDEGGLGLVYVANQTKLRRQVAVKVHPRPGDENDLDVRRFLTEARTMANLKHDNILPIFEFGCSNAQPYYMMPFIDPGSLKKKICGKPQSPMHTAAFVEEIARAVQYAHEQGVIHRDLKPENILLGLRKGKAHQQLPDQKTATSDEGITTTDGIDELPLTSYRPLVTDFGLAKDTTSSNEHTPASGVLGTPMYMSPEQAIGDSKNVRSATDIYSIGTILYEMLTGHPAFPDEGAPLATCMKVVYQEPVAPRKLAPNVPKDLEAICLKCMTKARKRRYTSAGALADDLRRFQEGKPVKAKRNSVAARIVKWIKRNRAAALVIVALSLAVLGNWLSRRDAVKSAEIASQNEEKANAAKRLAQKQTGVANRRLSFTKESVGTLVKLFENGNLLNGEHQDEFRIRALTSVERLLKQLLVETNNDESVESQNGLIWLHLGHLYTHTGQRQKQSEAYKNARKIFTKLCERSPNSADNYQGLATAYSGIADYHQAGIDYTHAIALCCKALNSRKKACELNSNNELDVAAFAQTHCALGILYTRVGRPTKASEAYTKALKLLDPIMIKGQAQPISKQSCRVYIETILEVGRLNRRFENSKEAEQNFTFALDRCKGIARQVQNDLFIQYSLARCHRELSCLYIADKRELESAMAHTESAIAIYKDLLKRHGNVPALHISLADAKCDYGEILQNLGDFISAEKMMVEGTEKCRRILNHGEASNDDRIVMARMLAKLAMLYFKMNNASKGKGTLSECLSIYDNLQKSSEMERGDLRDMAAILASLGNLSDEPAQKEKLRLRAISIYKWLNTRFPEVAVYQSELADVYVGLGCQYFLSDRHSMALGVFQKADAIFGQLSEKYPKKNEYKKKYAENMVYVAQTLEKTGMKNQYRETVKRAHSVFQRISTEFANDDAFLVSFALVEFAIAGFFQEEKDWPSVIKYSRRATLRADSILIKQPNSEVAQLMKKTVSVSWRYAALKLRQIDPSFESISRNVESLLRKARDSIETGDYAKTHQILGEALGYNAFTTKQSLQISRIYSECAASVWRDEHLPPFVRGLWSRHFEKSAISFLQIAITDKAFSKVELDKDTVLHPLRNSPEFLWVELMLQQRSSTRKK